jgi:solute:Na+ symporter, SSS family
MRLWLLGLMLPLLLAAADARGQGSRSATGSPADTLEWTALPPLPDPVGFASPFAGVSNRALIVAGGANFPEGLPWEGGRKIWHDRVFVLERPDGQWQELQQRLPRPLGYGVSLTTPHGVLCIGGSDAQNHFPDVFLLKWIDRSLVVEELPPLPTPLANMCGAMIGSVVFVAGGTEGHDDTEGSSHFFSMDLAAPERGWTALEPWPGPGRMLAVAGAQDSSFFLISGVALSAGPDGRPVRQYLKDAYRYTPGRGWRRVADLPHSVAAAPTPAIPVGNSHLLVIGGDDGSNVGFQPLEQHPGFRHDVVSYHAITDTWIISEEHPAPHVTTVVVPWNNGYVVPSGEVRPGVRSPDVHYTRPTQRRAGFGWANYLTLTLYLTAMVGIGVYFSFRNKTTEQFFRGGQRIPWWAAGLSIYATMLSSISYMAIPARAYMADWGYYFNAIAIFLVAPLVIFLYLPFYRQLDVTSAYEYLERRFNLAVRMFGSLSFMLLQIGRMAIVLYLPALALAAVSSFDIYTCILIMGVLCVVYTVLGGIEAVIWTDVVQSVVLAGGAILAFILVVTRIEGGLGAFWNTAAGHDKFLQNVAWWDWDIASATIAVVLIGSLFTNLVSYTASQDVVQRYMTTPDQKRAARSIWTNAIISVPSSAMFFLLGTALWVFYRTHPERLDPMLPNDSIFPQFMVRELPVGLAGIVVAGIFAAAQSTLSSSLNSVSTAFVTDFHKRLRPESSDQWNLFLARLVTIVLGVIAIGGAVLLARANLKSMWDVFLQVLGLSGGALAGLFALGIFTRRAHGAGALVGAVISAVVLYLVQRHTSVNFFLYGMIGIVTCFSVGYLASLILPASQKPLEGLTIHTPRDRWASEPREQKLPTPAGGCTNNF